MSSSTLIPPTPTPPPAPPVSELGAGGNPTVAPAAPVTTPQDVSIKQQQDTAAAISPTEGASAKTEKKPDLKTAEGRAEQYAANRQTQKEGESQYDDWYYKNFPKEYQQATPVHALVRRLTDAVTDATTNKNDPAAIRQSMRPLIHEFMTSTIGSLPIPGDLGGVGPTKDVMAAIPQGAEGVNLESVGGTKISPTVKPTPSGQLAEEGGREIYTPEPPAAPLPQDQYVYHATDKSRADAIRQNGLKPKSWYANSPEEALRSGVAPVSGNRADLRVFAVPRSEIEPVAPDPADIGARETEKGRFVMSAKGHQPIEVDADGRPVDIKTNDVAAKPIHPVLDAVRQKFGAGDVSDNMKTETSFIGPDGKVTTLGANTHAGALGSVPDGAQYANDETGRTNFINDAKTIRVAPQMNHQAGETFTFTVPKDGVTPEQVDALKQSAGLLKNRGNIIIETADKPAASKSNLDRPDDWQYKGVRDVEPILDKLGVHPNQTVKLNDHYGETGKYLGGAGDTLQTNHEEAQRRMQNGKPDNGAVNGSGTTDSKADVARREGEAARTDRPITEEKITTAEKQTKKEDEDATSFNFGANEKPAAKAAKSTVEPWAQAAADKAKTQGGGFTIDPHTGEAPTKGYQIEVGTENRKTLDHPTNARDIQNFRDANKDLFDKHPELHIGGYGNELNISTNTPDLAAAKKVASKLDQISVWDHAKGEEVMTGGKSAQKNFPDYPLEQRLADLKGEKKRLDKSTKKR